MAKMIFVNIIKELNDNLKYLYLIFFELFRGMLLTKSSLYYILINNKGICSKRTKTGNQ